MADQPDALFVVGAPRSGTSLLYKALCLHPRATWISNWMRRVPAVPQAAVLNRLAPLVAGQRRTVWFGSGLSNAYVYGGARRTADRFFPMPVEGEPVFTACGIGQRGPDPAIQLATPGAADRLASRVKVMRRFAGGPVFVNKRIANNQRMGLLLDAFPAARFVIMVRDGRAVAASLAKVDWWPESPLWWSGKTPLELEAEGADPMEVCAREWVEEQRALEEGRAAVPVDQQLTVRYEDLVSEPLETLRAVARFGGLGDDDRFETEIARLRFPDRNEAWRSGLAEKDVTTIERVQAHELRRQGYAA